jgi:hypothetical protein
MYLLGIVDGGHKVFFDLGHSAGIYAGDPARVVNTKKQGPAVPVQKGTDGLVHILVQLVPAFLELQVQAFAGLDELLYARLVDHVLVSSVSLLRSAHFLKVYSFISIY